MLSGSLLLPACWVGYAPFQGPPEQPASSTAQPAPAPEPSAAAPQPTPEATAPATAAPAPPSPSSHGPTPAVTPAPSEPPLVEAAALQALASVDSIRGWSLIPFAQFQRGQRIVVVGWLAFDSQGRVTGDRVVGLTFERLTDGQLQAVGPAWQVRGPSQTPTDIAHTLGGSDFTIIDRHQGLELERLGPELAQRCEAFSRAYRAGEHDEAMTRGTSLSRLLAFDQVAYANTTARLLYLCAGGESMQHLETTPQRGQARIQLRINRSSGAPRTLQLIARQPGELQTRWVISEVEH